MLAKSLSRWLKARNIHYAWVIMVVTFLTTLTTSGSVGVPGALIRPLSAEFGWDTAQISSALAIRLLLYGLIAPFAAAFIERYGIRRVITVAIAMILVGLLSAFAMTQVWHMVVLWGFVVGTGTGLTAIVLGAIVSTRWFVARRGLVLGFLTASTATGQLVFLPMVAWLVERVGWRLALLPSVIGLLLAALLVLLFLRDRPSDLGLLAYGEVASTPPSSPPLSAPAVAAAPQSAFARTFQTLFEAAGQPAFWVLFATFFICGLSTNGLVQTHFIPFCVDFGMVAVAAASVLAMMGVFDFFGTIASGWLSDRIDSRVLLTWYYGLRGLSLLYLPHADFTVVGLSVFAVFYGLDWIATVPPTVRLTTQNFGKERASIVFGWIFAGHQMGAATAAYGAGLSRTVLATYVPAFVIAACACLVAASIVWFLKGPALKQAEPTLAPAE